MALTERNHHLENSGSPVGPDVRSGEVPGPSVEIRFADLRRDAEGMARLFVQPSAIEHLGRIRDNDPNNREIDYTCEDVLQYFERHPEYRPIVARDSTGRVLGTITVEIPRQNAGRLQLWVSDKAIQNKGPGVGLELLQKAQAFIFGPVEYGGLGREYTKAGVILNIGGLWWPRAAHILADSRFRNEDVPQPGLAISYDLRRRDFVPRTLQNFSKHKSDYMQQDRNGWRNIRYILTELHIGAQPLPPQRPAAQPQ